jgi:hypothetical protein
MVIWTPSRCLELRNDFIRIRLDWLERLDEAELAAFPAMLDMLNDFRPGQQ